MTDGRTFLLGIVISAVVAFILGQELKEQELRASEYWFERDDDCGRIEPSNDRYICRKF